MKRGRFIAGIAFAATFLTGCTQTVAMDAAPNAANPGCAEIMVRLPSTVENLPLRETNAQATAAWGNPASVLLSCGLPPQSPTALPCLTIGTVDWIIDSTNTSFTTATTHGRLPVTQVVIDNSETGGQAILADLASAVDASPTDSSSAACK